MSRTQRILGATWIGYLHQGMVIVVGLWLTPFLLSRIGQDNLGLWLVAGQLLGYLALMDLGVLAMLPREVAYASGQAHASDEIGRLVGQVRRIVRWQVVALSAVCLTLWLVLPADWVRLRWPLAWVFGAFVVFYPLRVAQAALQGLQDLPFVAKTQMLGWAVGTSVTIGLVALGWSFAALVAGWTAMLAVPAIMAAWRLRAHRPDIRASVAGGSSGRHYVGRSVWVSLGQIAQVFLSGSDVLLIGKLLGAAAVVPYTCTGKLVTVLANHPQLLMHAAQPALAELRGSGSKLRLINITRALTEGMLIISGALVVVVVAANQFFVSWWVGPVQYGGRALTVALALMMLLRHWNVATIYTLFCFGYERQLSLTNLLDGVVSVTATVPLVWKLGPLGAPIASILGACVVSLPVNIRSVAAEMDVSIYGFLRPLGPVILRIVSVVGITVLAAGWFDTSRLATTIVIGSVAGAMYFVAIYPYLTSGPLGSYVRVALATTFARPTATISQADETIDATVTTGTVNR